MSGPQEVAQAFVGHFYQTFDSNVDGLAGLYVSCHVVVKAALCRWRRRSEQCVDGSAQYERG